MSFPGAPPPLALGAALATVHRDPSWWAKCLLHGALAITGVGLPLAAGFVLESYDNSRKGYPTPLPPWSDPVTRWLAGLFALLIDFTFFVIPLLVGMILLICVSVGLVVAGLSNAEATGGAIGLLGALWAALGLGMFLASAAPAGRLRFVDEGRPEQALGGDTLRWAMRQPARSSFLRARLASLPAYLPALLLGAGLYAAGRAAFPGQIFAVVGLLWLTASALVYAHLVVAQLYVAAEREAQRRGLGM